MIERLGELPARLEDLGFGEMLASLDPRCPNHAHGHERLRTGAPEYLKPLLDLFLSGRAVWKADLEPLIGDLGEALLGLALLKEPESGKVATRDLVLVRFGAIWLFVQRPQVAPTLYLGEDSAALANRLPLRRHGTALDLCAGPGAQALTLASRGTSVLAVDVNPVAVGLAEINAALNGLLPLISTAVCDVASVDSFGAFDLVCCNPPLLPVPQSLAYPFVGDGGELGLDLTVAILRQLPKLLAKGGAAHLLGTTLSDGIEPVSSASIRTLCRDVGIDLFWSVTSHHRMSAGHRVFEGLIESIVRASDHTTDETVAAYSALLSRTHSSHLCAYFMRARRGTGHVTLFDASDDSGPNFWHI